MKRKNVLLLATMLCLCLAGCGIEGSLEEIPLETSAEAAETAGTEAPQQSVPSPQSEDAVQPSEEPAEEPVGQSIDPVGLWHLDSEKNDLVAFADSLDLFPGYGEWGASMEIQSDGQMNWYIGAEGWHGTYTAEDGVIHARLTSDLEQSTQFWDFRILAENEKAVLEMDYQDMTIYWVYGGQGDAPMGSDESQDDTVYPGPDVVEIVNLRGDETTIYKLADGTYMDPMERHFTFNGTDTWTDENGVAWNEAAKD